MLYIYKDRLGHYSMYLDLFDIYQCYECLSPAIGMSLMQLDKTLCNNIC